MTEERKYAILFAATILCARKLIELDDKPSPARICAVERAIDQAAFILERIDSTMAVGTVALTPEAYQSSPTEGLKISFLPGRRPSSEREEPD
jgi:hypothetical protein